MKVTRILLTSLMVVAIAGAAHAQGSVRLSWNNCDPQISDMTTNAPVNYLQVVSALGLSAPNIGYDVCIVIGPNVPDAWRFDDLGCETGSQIFVDPSALSKGCPVLKGASSLPVSNVNYDGATKNESIRMVMAYDPFSPLPGTRYTLFQITYKMQFAVVGPSPDIDHCGHEEAPLFFDITGKINQQDGNAAPLGNTPGDVRVTANGGPVPAQVSTWGRLKGLYR